MFDRRSASEKFRLAVRNLGSNRNSFNAQPSNNVDPIPVLASIFRIIPTNTPTSATTSQPDTDSNNKANHESFQADNGTDWSSVLNPWLDVCEASAKVRLNILISIVMTIRNNELFLASRNKISY